MGRLELPTLTGYASETYAYTSSATCPFLALTEHSRLRAQKQYTQLMTLDFGNWARKILRRFRKMKRPYRTLVTITVSRDAILHNLHAFQRISPSVAVAPVLKSSAYGHGLREVGKILAGERVPFLCVDSFFEALALRNAGVRSPILVIGYTPAENLVRNTLPDISFCVIGLSDLREASRLVRTPTKIHLEIDTGMHRHGILPEELDDALSLIRSSHRLELEGVYSHLADADTPESPLNAEQIVRWNAAAERVRAAMPSVRYFHCAATAGSAHLPHMTGNVMRLGIGLYGINVSTEPLDLRPALEMTTRITSLRTVPEGETVGYNATYRAAVPTRIASIPAGYYEGVDRRLSNKGFVYVREIPCPIVGRVSMNITSIDVSDVPNVHAKDTVTVISKNPADKNSIEQIAATCATIPYEILVRLPAHLRRSVV